MPNPYHFRANIDRLWRRATGSLPAYIRLKALNAVAREIYPSNDRTRANYQMYLATDPYDVASHKLRDLYDHATPEASLCLPLPLGEGWGEGSPQSEEPADEDDDPL
ncbi:MAG: hypothetical protein OXG42_08315 [Chloroflexi bacterium]|nr:hypothetical protein [Chloroflexota bacterium]